MIALLASPNDGECLNACRMLARALRKEGADFHDLANGFVVREVTVYREAPRQEKEAPKQKPPPRDEPHAEVERLIARGSHHYRPAEWEFLLSLRRWQGQYTARQQQWLNDILARAKAA